MSKPILLTGAAGFIGSHVAKQLLERGDHVVGLDNLNSYYEVSLKEDRLKEFQHHPNFQFVQADVADTEKIMSLFAVHDFDYVVHLAAQAGVRYSLEAPHQYIQSNLVGFTNILEGCRLAKSKHLVYASSSSVYGLNRKMPFTEHASADHPVSLYGATKKANEVMAHSYSHLFQIPTTGLRFFTVYGPWGRPDMAPMIFARAITQGKPIQVFNEGKMLRDFTYVGDIVEGVIRAMDRPPVANPEWDSITADPATSSAPYRIFNIGNQQPVQLLRFIEVMEEALGMKAVKDMKPLQAGDVLETSADVEDLAVHTGFRPKTSVEEGISEFVKWFRAYYGG